MRERTEGLLMVACFGVVPSLIALTMLWMWWPQ